MFGEREDGRGLINFLKENPIIFTYSEDMFTNSVESGALTRNSFL